MSKQIMETLTKQREELDVVKKGIATLPNSRGKALAYTSIEKGRMYVGEILRELGKEYPYEKTKTATDASGIEEAVDLSQNEMVLGNNEITNLNIIRNKLDNELTVFMETIFDKDNGLKNSGNNASKFVLNSVVSEAYRGLKEGRMWLGIRLGEIRDLANKV